MSLMKSLDSGISGLRAFQTQMDVIGNNIANVDTTGFKSSRITFAEMLNQQIGGSSAASGSAPASGNQIGLGVHIAAIERDFNQGSLQSTGKTTDLALEGKGFFVVKNQNQNLLTRSGNFSFNKNGYLVDQAGHRVQGYSADSNGNILSSGTTDDLKLNFDSVYKPKATQNVNVAGNLNADTSTNQVVKSIAGLTTSGGAPATTSTDLNQLAQTTQSLVNGDTIKLDATLNDGTSKTVTYTYNSGDTVGDLINAINSGLGASEGSASLVDGMLVFRSAQMGDSQFNINSLTTSGTGNIKFPSFEVSQKGATSSKTISSTVYDSLGRAHTLLVKFTQKDNGDWDYTANFLDGEKITKGSTGTLKFDQSGNLSSSNNAEISFDPGNGASSTTFQLNFGDTKNGSKMTQFAGFDSTKVTSQDGFTQGKMVDVKIDSDGYVTGVYDNGQNITLAQIALAKVQNNDGLESLGNGMFRATNASGNMNLDTANNMSDTNVRSGSLEGSNVDLARQFTDMITSQRAYQSNARVITTADQLLNEAVNLKR
jgi:flagellar hook protein FlgE